MNGSCGKTKEEVSRVGLVVSWVVPEVWVVALWEVAV